MGPTSKTGTETQRTSRVNRRINKPKAPKITSKAPDVRGEAGNRLFMAPSDRSTLPTARSWTSGIKNRETGVSALMCPQLVMVATED